MAKNRVFNHIKTVVHLPCSHTEKSSENQAGGRFLYWVEDTKHSF